MIDISSLLEKHLLLKGLIISGKTDVLKNLEAHDACVDAIKEAYEKGKSEGSPLSNSENQYMITIMASFLSELESEKVITPMQRGQALKHLEAKTKSK